jgi:toxin HigB-1
MAYTFNVRLSRSALKGLKKIPDQVSCKLAQWIDYVGFYGLREVRKRPGYHDEPLLGKRWGQRSIRLSRSYRAIYVVRKDGAVHFIEILEVSKHAY